MSTPYSRIFHRRFRPLEPIPTHVKASPARLKAIRAVLFDLYGTLFVSGSGDVGVSRESACEKALAEAFKAVGVSPRGISTADLARSAMERFFAAIDDFHQVSRRNGIDFPEVDIVEVWRRVLHEMSEQGLPAKNVFNSASNQAAVKLLAAEYEARVNPAWPMPGLVRCLSTLRRRGIILGIISNAQFYTRDLFPALLGQEAEELGFDPHLQFYSYQHGWGKPGTRLFQLAADALREMSIEPAAALFIGNDVLNDIMPAAETGFRTALFAGDARSLRMRSDDSQATKIVPDLIITGLEQLDGCIIN